MRLLLILSVLIFINVDAQITENENLNIQDISFSNIQNQIGGNYANPPYPILFIHGLDGNLNTWNEVINYFSQLYGEKETLRFCLNSDYNNSTANYLYDITSFDTEGLANRNLYQITFDCDANGNCDNENNYLSNQAAIFKQGKAIGMAIASIVQSTGKDKVILIGHSMGGLAAREYIQNSQHHLLGYHSVAKLVTVGTPHWGSNFELAGLGDIFQVLTDINSNSEAVRDLRNSYDLTFLNKTPAVYLFGGIEDQYCLADDFFFEWHNVDINCNGLIYENIEGLNTLPIYTDIDYSSVWDPNDNIVDTIQLGYTIPMDISGGENFCFILGDNFYCESFKFDAEDMSGNIFNDYGHKQLAKEVYPNLLALDESDNYQNSYEIELNEIYSCFFTNQVMNLQSIDYDVFKFYIPADGYLNIDIFYADSLSYGNDVMLESEGLNANEIIASTPSTLNPQYYQNINNYVQQGWYYVKFHRSLAANEFTFYAFELSLDVIEPSWNCVNSSCVDPLDGSGIYSSLNDCELSCDPIIESSWNCVNSSCVDPLDGSGIYSSLNDCELICDPIIESSWNCVNSSCIDPFDGSGIFSSLNDCELECHTSNLNENNKFYYELYPNPSTDIFNVEFSTNANLEIDITVVNSIGQEIFKEMVEIEGQYIKQIDLSNYSKGIYNISFKTGDEIMNYRLILQ